MLERIAARRNRLLVLNAFGFIVWQVASFGPHLANLWSAPAVIALGLVGFGVWAWTLVLLLRRIPDPHVRAVLDDELSRHHWQRSMQAGYWSMLMTAAVGLAITSLVPVAAVHALRAMVALGVAVPLLRFARLERAGGDD